MLLLLLLLLYVFFSDNVFWVDSGFSGKYIYVYMWCIARTLDQPDATLGSAEGLPAEMAVAL